MGIAAGDRRLTPRQLTKIWAAAKELHWEDERLHRELKQVTGAKSLRQLSVAQAVLFIDFQVGLGASSGRHSSPSCQIDGRGPARGANIVELATPAQHRYIDELLALAGWTRETPYWIGCLKKGTKRTTVRTRREAKIAITILRRTIGRRAPSESGGSRPAAGESAL